MAGFSRREFIQGAFALGAVTSLPRPGSTGSAALPVLERLEISSPRLPEAFDGYRIGFLSDIHYGAWLGDDVLNHIIMTLNSEDLDLLLLGGDYIWIHAPWIEIAFPDIRNTAFSGLSQEAQPGAIMRGLADFVASIRTRDGSCAVLGNHDRWYATEACLKFLPESGTQLMINQEIPLRRGKSEISLLGLDDYWTGAPRIPAKSASGDDSQFRILLTHNPDLVSEILTAGRCRFDLALCGHTHGGQVKLPGLPAPFYNIYDRRFAQGLVPAGNSLVYTGRGIGVVELPFRLNCPAEITLVTLRTA